MKRPICHWDTPYGRYSISEWSAMIAEAGFLIRRLHEPRPTPEQVQRKPSLEKSYRLPMCVILDLVKPG